MTACPQRKRLAQSFWLRMLGWSAAATVAVVVVFSGVSWRTPRSTILEAFAVSGLFSLVISGMLGLVMPSVARRVHGRLAFPIDWIVLIAAMVTVATAGSLVTILTLAAAGYLDSSRIVATWMAGALKVSIVVTLTFGIFGTLVETMRRRLDQAALALRTKERDEAEAHRLAAEAQLASLESRVQPHFLFNTLNSIAALAHDDPAGAERMTGQLASLLRSALDSTATPLVPLEQELRVVRAYLDIERVRFGDRLRYDVEIGDGAAAVSVPRMALQTLVENSIKYAVSPRREGGTIRVTAAVTGGNRLTITVEDDGAGFDGAQRPEGHGLALLDARLAMLFGDRASMRVDSRAGRTVVMLDLPS